MSSINLALAVFGTAILASACAGDQVKYGIASWPVNLGNHRAVVRVSARADAVEVTIPWRRRDANPQDKDILIYDAATGQQVRNVVRVDINRENGVLRFQPATVPGEYFIYYMPYKRVGDSWVGNVAYDPPTTTADPAWKANYEPSSKAVSLPAAELVEMQSRGDLQRFDPMEVIATQQEVIDLLKSNPLRSFLIFPEDRRYPIRMTDYLPQRWIERGPTAELRGEAQRGEFYAFQVGLYAARAPIEDIAVTCTELASASGGVIPPGNLSCTEILGRDWMGKSLRKPFKVETSRVGPLWFGLQIPQAVQAGEYTGTLYIKPKGAPEAGIKLVLQIRDPILEDSGDSELWRMSRLRWLDSDIGIDETVTAPYTPIKVNGATIGVLGREVRFGKLGLPESITSGGREILAGPAEFVVETAQGKISLGGRAGKAVTETPSELIREASGGGGGFSATCRTKSDYDGNTAFRISVSVKTDTDAKDIRLEIPIKRDVAVYMMGLGRKGGYRPNEWKWAWNPQGGDAVWIGDFNAGLRLSLKAPQETWDIYDREAEWPPKSWENGGKGGCDVIEQGDRVIIRAYSGARKVKAGETLDFCFGLLVTPVKPLDPAHFKQRYYHFYKDVVKVDDIVKTGANIINIHQGNELNPNINYPFLHTDKMKAYVDEAHAKGCRAKIYYTVRELTNRVVEMWPLRSLGDEVFYAGGGGGDAWLIEHLGNRYSPAWHDVLSDGEVDAAIATKPFSRWNNYYLEGLSWLIKNVGIDGLYLDGIGYDREIMKRVRRVMDQAKPGCLIDFHSGNNYAYNDNRISPANQYMEHFPYIDSLWFGELYDYNETPDYYLVEISGIPYGLYGEMLQGGGNPWRGMLYGMSNRLGWGGDPRNIWKVWDDFGIQDAKLLGYWDPACPVKTDNKDILATVYAKKGSALISIASWAKEPAQVKLTVDWKALGMNVRKAHLSAAAVPGFQDAADFPWSKEIPVEPGKGWLLVLREE